VIPIQHKGGGGGDRGGEQWRAAARFIGQPLCTTLFHRKLLEGVAWGVIQAGNWPVFAAARSDMFGDRLAQPQAGGPSGHRLSHIIRDSPYKDVLSGARMTARPAA
jgi:hypothetical protein